jgi:hypothetical protein
MIDSFKYCTYIHRNVRQISTADKFRIWAALRSLLELLLTPFFHRQSSPLAAPIVAERDLEVTRSASYECLWCHSQIKPFLQQGSASFVDVIVPVLGIHCHPQS